MKKKDFGTGKWNGFGGKIKDGETPEHAAVRELAEESGLVAKPTDLQPVGVFRFFFNNKKEPEFHVRTYCVYTWRGVYRESDEMIPRWHPIDALPTEDMWQADREWIPYALNGTPCYCDVHYTIDGAPGTAQETFDHIEWLESEPPEEY